MLNINGCLYVVADNAAAPMPHGACVRISQRYLGIWCVLNLDLDGFQFLQLFFEFDDAFVQMSNLAWRQSGLIAVSRVQLGKVALDTGFNVRQSPPHLGRREVLIPVVHRFELAAINRNTVTVQQTDVTT